ncbi:MAG: CCA tRNA nucleotidyltransferase [Candidatus Woesearchaeota archaeon]
MQSVLKKYKFSEKEMAEIMDKVNSFCNKLSQKLKKNNVSADVMLGGSAAKGTLIKGDFDCDIFVRFNDKYSSVNISDVLENALHSQKYQRLHGSRDYFQVYSKGIKYEIVPVLRVDKTEQAKNVTDLSPLHVSWIKARIQKNPSLVDEILLAKLFCKAQNLYGAESYIRGFSGHVLDILVAYYGSFESLLRNAVHWHRYKVIDIEGHNSRRELNKSKISPLIVIDPIQKDRNAAAALSIENFELFKKRAKEYIDHPSPKFFDKKPITVGVLRRLCPPGRDAVILEVSPLEGKEDIIGTKMLKVFIFISRQLELHDFIVTDKGWSWDRKKKALMWFFVPKGEIAHTKEHMGPPLHCKKDVSAFKAAHRDTFVRGHRIFARIKRQFVFHRDLIEHLINQSYIKEKVASVRLLSENKHKRGA